MLGRELTGFQKFLEEMASLAYLLYHFLLGGNNWAGGSVTSNIGSPLFYHLVFPIPVLCVINSDTSFTAFRNFEVEYSNCQS